MTKLTAEVGDENGNGELASSNGKAGAVLADDHFGSSSQPAIKLGHLSSQSFLCCWCALPKRKKPHAACTFLSTAAAKRVNAERLRNLHKSPFNVSASSSSSSLLLFDLIPSNREFVVNLLWDVLLLCCQVIACAFCAFRSLLKLSLSVWDEHRKDSLVVCLLWWRLACQHQPTSTSQTRPTISTQKREEKNNLISLAQKTFKIENHQRWWWWWWWWWWWAQNEHHHCSSIHIYIKEKEREREMRADK